MMKHNNHIQIAIPGITPRIEAALRLYERVARTARDTWRADYARKAAAEAAYLLARDGAGEVDLLGTVLGVLQRLQALGHRANRQGETAEALRCHTQFHEAIDVMLASHPDDHRVRHGKCGSLLAFGEVSESKGNLAAAAGWYAGALVIANVFAAGDPEPERWQCLLKHARTALARVTRHLPGSGHEDGCPGDETDTPNT